MNRRESFDDQQRDEEFWYALVERVRLCPGSESRRYDLCVRAGEPLR